MAHLAQEKEGFSVSITRVSQHHVRYLGNQAEAPMRVMRGHRVYLMVKKNKKKKKTTHTY